MTNAKSVVVMAWDGQSVPLAQIDFDEQPGFELMIFNYMGTNAIPAKEKVLLYDSLVSIRTEFKGVLMLKVQEYLKHRSDIEYIGFVDDDMALSISSINQLLREAQQHGLDVFQGAIDPTSFYSHLFNVYQHGKYIDYVNWVEIMMPFYRKSIFDALLDYLPLSISSYGIDCYAVPYVQKKLGLTKTAIVHSVMIKHTKPVTDGSKRFSNGLTARQEGELVRKKIVGEIKKANQPSLFTDTFMKEVYGVGTVRVEYYKYALKEWLQQLLRRN